jgi:hypothetical protein
MAMNIEFFGLANLDVLNSFFDEGERAAVVAALSFCGKLIIKNCVMAYWKNLTLS